MFCHNCGTPRLPEAKFCPLCGCRLTDLSQLTSAPAEITPTAPAPVAEEPVPAVEIPVPEAAEVCPAAEEPVLEEAVPEAAISEEPVPEEAIPEEAVPEEATSEEPVFAEAEPSAEPQAVSPAPYIPAYAARPVPPPYPIVTCPPVAAPAASAEKPTPAPKKGRHRVPLLIMAGMVLIGLILFIATAGKTAGAPQDPSAATQSETPWFRNDEGTLYFDASLYTGSSELTIPETVDGEPVVCISEGCFADNTAITTVILPESLEEIGSGAFSGCTSIRGIFIPEGVKIIGSGAFRDCTKLEAICIPGSVEAIGYNTFRGCNKLKYIIYEGDFREWLELYSGKISSETQVYCDDGTYSHSAFAP